MTTIMVSCGEPSGDLYAGALAAELKRLDPSCRIVGLGGERLAGAGGELVGDFRGLSVTGLTEALSVLPRSLAAYRRLVEEARRRRPDVLVAIDFPDFNFRLARALRRMGVPIVYYVPPQLWAWRRGRLRTIAKLAGHVLVIFPFEAAIYERAGIPVTFVGHPLVDLACAKQGREATLTALGLDPAAPTVALLPGSRPNEVRALAPVVAGAAGVIGSSVPAVQFVVARAPGLEDSLFQVFRTIRSPHAIAEGITDEVIGAADIVLTCSGTATVQTAIHGRPMVVMYRLSPLTYRLGKPFVRVDTYGMVNLVAGRTIVPELIQDDLDEHTLAAEAISLLTDRERAAQTRADLDEVRRKLGCEGASRRAAESVLRAAGRMV
ncbi:MAG: lipid-A-disaccharide synthase [Vicinamibacterales bacterium]